MSNEEVGQYTFLLCEAWLSGKDASLPDNPEVLARKARCRKVSDKVLAQFPVVQTTYGPRRQNETLYSEWRAATSRIALASDMGRKGNEVRWGANRVGIGGPSGSDAALYRPNQTKPTQSNPTQTEPELDMNTGQCSFKNIAIQYSSFFGGHHSKGKKHIERYQQACSKYGEDKVLEYFKRWAEGSGWLKTQRNPNGLNFFWKSMEEMAEGDQLREEREQSTSQSEQTERVEVEQAMAADSARRSAEIEEQLKAQKQEKEFAEAHRYEI